MAKVTIELTVKEFKHLAEFLTDHESDIALCVNDFKSLTGLFLAVFEDDPESR